MVGRYSMSPAPAFHHPRVVDALRAAGYAVAQVAEGRF